MIKSAVSSLLSRSRLLVALRQHVGMVPARLSGDRSWSQHGEDAMLVEKLASCLDGGFYVDIGANHPARLSNTYRLYRQGMRGICVEPNDMLCRLHARYRPGDVALCTAVGPEPGILKFFEMSYHALSTFSEDQSRSWQERGVRLVRESFKPVFPLTTIIERCRPAGRDVFALLTVDAEGWDEAILRSSDWDRFRPRLVVVERISEDEASSTDAFLESVGYRLVESFGCNGVYAERGGGDRR